MLKKIVRKIDDMFLGKTIQKKYNRILTAKSISAYEAGFEYKLVTYYEKNTTCELSRLCDLYGSDKGEISRGPHPYPWRSHTYTDFYSRLFWHCRDSVRNVFECGLGTNNPDLPSSMGVSGKPGASLRVWRDFFPNAMIYGADIDRDVLFEEDRIKTFYIDQLNPGDIEIFWQTVGKKDFDFIVDDGLHTFDAGSILFLNSIERLAPNGIYVIEDVGLADVTRYMDFFQNKDYAVEYVLLHRPAIDLGNNNLVVIRKKDVR